MWSTFDLSSFLSSFFFLSSLDLSSSLSFSISLLFVSIFQSRPLFFSFSLDLSYFCLDLSSFSRSLSSLLFQSRSLSLSAIQVSKLLRSSLISPLGAEKGSRSLFSTRLVRSIDEASLCRRET